MLPRLLPALTLALLTVLPGARAQTITPTVISIFPAATAAGSSTSASSALIQDAAGNFYGTTEGGGANNSGTVYKVTPAGQYSTLYSFTGGTGGQDPFAGLLLASDGNFYGTAAGGGANNYGTVYQLTPAGVLTTLHNFNLTDGRLPHGTLVQGPDGTLYGTTVGGGVNNTGTVFSITTAGVFTTLHSFVTGDGTAPQSGLLLARDGNFYGTTAFNGTPDNRGLGNGSVYAITPQGMFTVLHLFDAATEGNGPFPTVVQGRDGAFYGANANGGANGSGTIWKVTSSGAFTVLYTFSAADPTTSVNGDGAMPGAALVDGGDGKFYGSTSIGGANGTGTVFSITPAGVLTTVYNFSALDANGVNSEGAFPFAGFLKAGDGRLYAPLPSGGANGEGTIDVFSLHPAFFAGEASLANGVSYLSFSTGNFFGYYSFLSDPNYIFHFDLGYEYVFDANDGASGVYLYDFKSNTFFYTSPTFGFPYLYDFTLNAVLYYYPDTANPGHYTTNPRFFYNFSTGKTIMK